jgi:hypothetical protein
VDAIRDRIDICLVEADCNRRGRSGVRHEHKFSPISSEAIDDSREPSFKTYADADAAKRRVDDMGTGLTSKEERLDRRSFFLMYAGDDIPSRGS